MVCQFQCNIVYDTKKSLENDIGARTFDDDKSAPHFHRFKLRQNAPLSDLFIFSAVNTSKTSFQIAKEFTIKGSGFKMFLAVTKNFQNIVS